MRKPVDLCVDTDGAFAQALMAELSNTFPEATIELEGPAPKALLSEGAIAWTFAGTMAVLTVTGGIGPALDHIRAIVDYLRNGYRAASENDEELRSTTFRSHQKELSFDGEAWTYREREVSIELPYHDLEEISQVLGDVLQAPVE